VDAGAWREFQEQWQRHVRTYGHAVYDLDFAKPLPADEPGPLLDTLRFFLEGQTPNPHARQADAAAAREAATRRLLARLDPVRRRVFRTLLRIAQRFAPLREDALMDVGLGWPVLRRMAAELGRRLVAAGTLAGVDDVFWLTAAELQAAAGALDAGGTVADCRERAKERRATWQVQRRLTPPPSLPPKARATFAGFDFTRFLPARADDGEGAIIRGVGASPGRMAGTACVLHGPEDFGQMRPGGVLVAKITTPAWTPLFALASGVVTDVGGPLSHSSIVAREYHIPAVLGTGVATARIQMGQRIEVDGDAGTVRLLDTPGGER
jgi:pyruvate,water dikinase